MDPSDEKKWADVVFAQPPFRCFTYEVPQRFHRELISGQRVLVPLGSRKLTGFIVNFISNPKISELREIEDVFDPYPLLNQELLKLTRWVAEYYLSSWGEVVRTALPPGIHRESRQIVRNIGGTIKPDEPLSDFHKSILSIVRSKGKISIKSLERQLGRKSLRFALAKLERMGTVKLEHVLEEPKVQVLSKKWISLKEINDPESGRKLCKRAPKQAEILTFLKKCGGEIRRDKLDVDFSILRRLEKNGFIEIWEEEVFRDTYQGMKVEPSKPVILTEEQRNALSNIDAGAKQAKFQVFLLHGVTGSGKTQIYIESIRNTLDQGKTALVLIPEISLTPQAVHRYKGAFGDVVAVLHSGMSAGERYDSWRKIREGKFRIGLGPRSAVFAPLENLGLIVVDEEHETSYKQTDPAPRYHARDVAIVRGKFNDCAVILGSATPSLESYFNAVNGKYTLCELTHRVDHIPMPRVSLVNRKQTSKDEKNQIFSPLLVEKMKERLKEKEQTILLQNRRGYATFLRCTACGSVEECPHCDITLTYHQKEHRMRCHYCGFHKSASEVCLVCGGVTLKYSGVGTQRVEEEVRKLFPEARLFRMDLDTTRRKGSHDRIVLDFEKGKGDVLLGTQMVAKGHDFPGVRLVGIISADTELLFPDFRSGERTFQLLTQAAGRSGRRNLSGEVVIQTLSPDNPVLHFAVEQDYTKFFQCEIEQRKELNYPPYGRIIVVRFKGVEEKEVARAAHHFKRHVEPGSFFELLGPVSCPLSRIKGKYRYQIIFREKKIYDPSGKKLRQKVKESLTNFYNKSRFNNVRVSPDVDPVDMM